MTDLADAANLMRAKAGAATPGPWFTKEELDGVYAGQRTVVFADGKRITSVGQTRRHHGFPESEHNTKYIASMHPAVALAVADLIDWHAAHDVGGPSWRLAHAAAGAYLGAGAS